MNNQTWSIGESTIPSVSWVIDASRMGDAAYREHVLFDLFVALHRYHNLQPDADKPYMITRSVENWDVWVSLCIADPLPAIKPGTLTLFLDRRMVEAWVLRLKLEPWPPPEPITEPPQALLRGHGQ